MAYKSRFTDKPTKRVSAGQLRQKTRDSYSKSFNKQQREVRRDKQQKELDQFKSDLKVAPGTTNLYQEQAPKFNPQTGKYERTTLAQKAIELSNKYGPTPRELLGDIGSGIGSIAGGLMNRVSSGDFGIMGIAKGLYNQVANRAAQAKDALAKSVNKLSDIDLEFLKNEEKYPQMSSHPRIQGIKDIQEIGRTETEKADIIRQNMERISTPIMEKDNTVQSAKVFQAQPGSGYQAGAGMGLSALTPTYNFDTNYETPEQRMQKLIQQSQQNNTSMFNSGVMTPKQTENLFNIDLQ